jgi:hypothetical protein
MVDRGALHINGRPPGVYVSMIDREAFFTSIEPKHRSDNNRPFCFKLVTFTRLPKYISPSEMVVFVKMSSLCRYSMQELIGVYDIQ